MPVHFDNPNGIGVVAYTKFMVASLPIPFGVLSPVPPFPSGKGVKDAKLGWEEGTTVKCYVTIVWGQPYYAFCG